MNAEQILSKEVVCSEGRTIGEVQYLHLDQTTWTLTELEIKLERSVLEELNLEKPLLGTQTVRLGFEHIEEIGERIRLKRSITELRYAFEVGAV